jgi:hypothetical protein
MFKNTTFVRFCWFVYDSACGSPECLCGGGNLVYSGRSFVVVVSVTSVVFRAALWCSFPILL